MCLQQVRNRDSLSGLTASQTKRIITSLGELRGALEKMFDISLPAPCFARGELFLTNVKKFCGGLLEHGTTHIWRDSIRQLSRVDKMTVAGSLFLFRKVLPTPDPDIDIYIEKMSSPQPPADPLFLAFVRREVPKLFRPGWDRHYADNVLRMLPSASSCFETGRKDGGCRGMSARGEWLSRFDAVDFCLSSPYFSGLGPSKVCSVDTGGKKRIISIPPADMNLLRPLHVSMYNHLSQFPWLLRGDAKPSKFGDFSSVEGEVFVSGDYESATDNLNSEVQREILRLILDMSDLPSGVKEMALATLSMRLQNPRSKKFSVQHRGQLMGNLLSFPLLCIVNFLAFKYVVPRKVPLRVNGDDLVFRGTVAENDRWMKEVGRSGLTLSLGKTMVDRRFFSLNSCWFRSYASGCKLVPVIRSTALGLGQRGECDSLRGRFSSFCVGFGRKKKDILHGIFLRLNSGMIHATNRSVTRGLGMYVSYDVLVESRMWARENFYLSMEKEHPLPPKKNDLSWQVKLPGWSRTYGSMGKEDRVNQREYAAAAVDVVWSTPPVTNADLEVEYRNEVKEGTFSFSTWLAERKAQVGKWSGLLRVGRKELRVLFKPSRRLFDRWPRPMSKSWFFVRDESASRRFVKFSSAREVWKGGDVYEPVPRVRGSRANGLAFQRGAYCES